MSYAVIARANESLAEYDAESDRYIIPATGPNEQERRYKRQAVYDLFAEEAVRIVEEASRLAVMERSDTPYRYLTHALSGCDWTANVVGTDNDLQAIEMMESVGALNPAVYGQSFYSSFHMAHMATYNSKTDKYEDSPVCDKLTRIRGHVERRLACREDGSYVKLCISVIFHCHEHCTLEELLANLPVAVSDVGMGLEEFFWRTVKVLGVLRGRLPVGPIDWLRYIRTGDEKERLFKVHGTDVKQFYNLSNGEPWPKRPLAYLHYIPHYHGMRIFYERPIPESLRRFFPGYSPSTNAVAGAVNPIPSTKVEP